MLFFTKWSNWSIVFFMIFWHLVPIFIVSIVCCILWYFFRNNWKVRPWRSCACKKFKTPPYVSSWRLTSFLLIFFGSILKRIQLQIYYRLPEFQKHKNDKSRLLVNSAEGLWGGIHRRFFLSQRLNENNCLINKKWKKFKNWIYMSIHLLWCTITGWVSNKFLKNIV